MQPARSTVGPLRVPGTWAGFTNAPSDCIRMSCEVGSVPTDFNIFLHAIPDALISSGQLTLQGNYNQGLVLFENMLVAGLGPLPRPQWLGRNPAQLLTRVVAVNGPAGTITAQVGMTVVPGTTYIRLHRVYDDVGNPIKGTFLCTAAAAPVNGTIVYTVLGMPDLTASRPSGTCRVDEIAVANITDASISSLSSRKVGRPTLVYRGRRSRSR